MKLSLSMCIGLLRLPRKSKTTVVAHRRLSETRRDSYAMGPTVCFLLAVGFLACLMHLTPVRSQCTTKHCDQGDNELSVLTAMVTQLMRHDGTAATLNGTAATLIGPNATGTSTLNSRVAQGPPELNAGTSAHNGSAADTVSRTATTFEQLSGASAAESTRRDTGTTTGRTDETQRSFSEMRTTYVHVFV